MRQIAVPSAQVLTAPLSLFSANSSCLTYSTSLFQDNYHGVYWNLLRYCRFVALDTTNYFIIGWFNGYLYHYYIDSFKVYFPLIVVFSAMGNFALVILRYRLSKKTLFSASKLLNHVTNLLSANPVTSLRNFTWLLLLPSSWVGTRYTYLKLGYATSSK